MLKTDAMNIICGLSSSARQLADVDGAGDAIKQLVAAVEKIAKEIAESPVSRDHL